MRTRLMRRTVPACRLDYECMRACAVERVRRINIHMHVLSIAPGKFQFKICGLLSNNTKHTMADSSPIPAVFLIVRSSKRWIGLTKEFTTVTSKAEALTRAVGLATTKVEDVIHNRTAEEAAKLLAEPGWWHEFVNYYHECEEPLVTCKLFIGGT